MNLSPMAGAALVAALTLAGCASTAPDPKLAELAAARRALVTPATTRTEARPLVLAHFMTWYQARPYSKSFGWHWHMGSYDPYEVAPDGTRPLATHTYPLIGPYDSADPAVIEYQLMTMKAAGIDGVIVDWYGIDQALDYVAIHRATQALFEAVRRAGMTFVVCYEDQSLDKMVQARVFDREHAVERAAATLRWMDEHWFHDPAYLHWDGRPVLLDFGPQAKALARWSDWEQVLGAASPRPFFVSLEDHAEHEADAFYNWPELSRSVGGVLSLATLVEQLNTFYRKTRDHERLVATAWPGFHDIYQQAGVADSYGYLDDYGGETFRLTLSAALAARPTLLQLATWNDYGEGTVLEPNRVRGYGPLEDLQAARRQSDPSFPFSADDLRLPLALRNAPPEAFPDPDARARLVEAFLAGRIGEAREMARRAGLID